MKKIISLFSGIPMTMAGGVCLLASLFFMLRKTELVFDPAWVAVVVSGLPMLYYALHRLFSHRGLSRISSPLLISIAMLAAIAIGDVFAAGEVAFIMAIGGILEEKTTERSKKGLFSLIQLAPRRGRRLRDEQEESISAEEIRVGDLLRVLPGETIPVDGVIVTGYTSVDQAVMTGESLPVDKAPGDAVFCGTQNRFGAFDMEATKVGEDSSLQKLIRMVQDAEDKQAPIQRVADVWAARLVPAALVLAVLTVLLTKDLVRGVTVLVVFCPCALVLATPTAIMAAIGQATRHGIIIKSGEALETMGRVNKAALDKTGTLTLGKLAVSDVLPLEETMGADGLLLWTASAESRSEHPLGKALVAYAKERNLPLKPAENFRMAAGKGIFASVENRELYCGSESYITENGIELPPSAHRALELLRSEGKASILTALDGRCVGVFGLSDKLRPGAREAIAALEAAGTETVLLTGDHREAALYFARLAGIREVKAELLPEEKVRSLEEMRRQGSTVCMIGDGVNDAPALKAASVGIAMGVMGSDIAVEAADIALMSDDLSRLPYLKRLSNATVRTIRLGISLSLFINFAAILLSFFGLLNPTTGALVHNAGSLFVVLIAAELYNRKFD